MKGQEAASVVVMFCENPACLRPHVMLMDEGGSVFASFIVPDPRDDGGFIFDLWEALERSQMLRRRL